MSQGKCGPGLRILGSICILLVLFLVYPHWNVSAEPLDPERYRAIERFILRFDEGRARTSHPASKATMAERRQLFLDYVGNLQLFSLVPQEEQACLMSLLRERAPENDFAEAMAAPPRAATSDLELNDPCYPIFGTPRLGPGGWALENPDATEDDLTRPAPFLGRGEGGGGIGGGAGRTGGGP